MALNERTYFGFHRSTGDQSRNAASGIHGVPALLVPSTDRDLHFASAADFATDWNVANPSHPTLYVHSETTPATDYMSLSHNGTSGIINVAGGTLALQIGGTTELTLDTDSLTWGGDLFVSDTFGVVIGHSAQETISDGDGSTDLIPEFQMMGTAQADSTMMLAQFNTTNASAAMLAFVKGGNAAIGSHTTVADNEYLGRIVAFADDSADLETPAAEIRFVVDGTPAASQIGGSIEFLTTPDGSTTLTAAMTITSAQNLVITDGNGLWVGSPTAVTISNGDGSTNLVPEVQVLGTAAADGSILVASFNTTNDRTVSPHIALVKGAAATQVATTAVANDEVVGSIIAYGSDGADFETPVAAIEFVVDDSGGPGAGAIGGSLEFYTTADGGETLTKRITINTAGNVLAEASTVFQSSAAGEIAFVVTNEALTIGSEGSVVIPYRSSNDAAFTDTEGGNLNGAIGIQYDSDTGPTTTLEGRSNDAWVSVALTGYLMQNKVEFDPRQAATVLHHPNQIFTAPGISGEMRHWIDESKCLVCGELMNPGEQTVMYANYRRDNGLHNIFGHPHMEKDPYVKSLEDRIAVLEAERIIRDGKAEKAPAGRK